MDTIKRIGRYTVPFEVFTDVVAELKLVVAPEGEELPPEEELAALEAQEAAEARGRGRRRSREPQRRPSRGAAVEADGGAPRATPGAAEDADVDAEAASPRTRQSRR